MCFKHCDSAVNLAVEQGMIHHASEMGDFNKNASGWQGYSVH
jgi:hypothetical protein